MSSLLPSFPTNTSILLLAPSDLWPRLQEEISSGLHPADFWLSDPEKGLTIEAVRHAQQFAALSPIGPRKRICLLQAADWSPVVANSLLKLLEEPPAYLQLFLLSESDQLPDTLRSRLHALAVTSATIKDKADALDDSALWRQQLSGLTLIHPQERRQALDLLYLYPLQHGGIRTATLRQAFNQSQI